MFRKTVFILLSVCYALSVSAQELTVKKMEQLPFDTYASEHKQTDNNGVLCAAVRVSLPLDGATFSGTNHIDSIARLGAEYILLMPASSKKMYIQHPNYHELEVNFDRYGFDRLESLATYRVTINVPQDGDVIIDDTKEQKVLFHVTPVPARIKLRQLSFNTDEEGSFQIPLPIGSFHYTVSADDYDDFEGVVETHDDADVQTIDVVIRHCHGFLDVTVAQTGATVKIDGHTVGTSPFHSPVELDTGPHTVEVSCPNHRTETRSVTIENRRITSVSFDLVNTALFTIDSTPSGASLFIDGEKKGLTPCRIELASGDYLIKLTKNKYKELTKQMHLDSSRPELNLRLARVLQQKNSAYLQGGLQAGSLMAAGATMGFYAGNVNAETSYLIGLAESEELYWNSISASAKREPVRCVYKPTMYCCKLGYGITLGTRLRITPQAGASIIGIEGGEDGNRSKGYALSGAIGTRCDYALAQGFGIFAAPEVMFALSQSPVYKQVAAVSAKVARWGSGFNVRAGLTFFL